MVFEKRIDTKLDDKIKKECLGPNQQITDIKFTQDMIVLVC